MAVATKSDGIATDVGIPATVISVTVAIVALFWATFAGIVSMWSLETYEYGWLVYPVSFYLIFRSRHLLASVETRPSYAGVAATAVLLVLWLIARISGVQVVEAMAVTLLIGTVTWSIVGTEASRKLLFPLVFLLTSVPIGESLIGPLMRVTADISTVLLGVLGVPAFRDGMFLTLPGGVFEVADVCSGLQYLLAGTVVSLLFAYLSYTSNRKRAIFVAATIVSFIVANGIRATIVMFIASATDQTWFVGDDHLLFGIVLFALLMAALLLIGSRFADKPTDAPDAGDSNPTIFAWSTVVLVSMLLVGGRLAGWGIQSAVPAVAIGELPGVLGDCGSPHDWAPEWLPMIAGADHITAATYQCDSQSISIFRASFAGQRQGRELVSSSHELWPSEWRQFVDESVVEMSIDDRTVEIREVIASRPERNTLIYSWYQVDDKITSSDFAAKLHEVTRVLTLRSGLSALVICTIDGADAPPELRRALQPVVREIIRHSIGVRGPGT